MIAASHIQIGIADGTVVRDGGYYGLSEMFLPLLVLGSEIFQQRSMLGIDDLLKLIHSAGERSPSLFVGVQKTLIACDLVPTDASLFINNQLFDPDCQGYGLVRFIDAAHRTIRARDLPHKDCCKQKTGHDRQNENLPKSSFKAS